MTEPDAESIEEQAEGKGNLGLADRLRRDRELCGLIMSGVPVAIAAQMHGLGERQAYRIYEDFKPEELNALEDLDPRQYVEKALEQYQAAIEQLAMLAAETNHDGVRVSAIRTRLEAVRGRVELLQSLGLAPLDLGTLRLQDDWMRVARIILDVLDAYEVSEAVQVAVMDAVEGRTPQLPEGKRIIDLEGS